MSENTSNNAIIMMVLVPVLTAIGGWVTARIQNSTEKPTDVFIKSLQEARARIAELEKAKIELTADVLDERRLKREERKHKNQYIVRAEQLERILQKNHILFPEMESNGTTPDYKKADG